LTYRCRVPGVALAALCTGLLAGSARAATITVANTNDSGAGSVRQAISDAIGGDTIAIPGGTYELASALVVDKSLTFIGAGARSTVLDGGGATRIFSLQQPAAQVTIVRITMRDGKGTNGGALTSEVPVTLTDDAILGSTAGGGNGGGLYTTAAFTMERDLVAGNTAPGGDGGGIEFAPASPLVATISDSTLTQNSAGGAGGALNDFNTSTETVHLEGDSLVANAAARGGNFRAWTGTHIDYHNTLIAQGSAPVGPNCAYGGGAFLTSDGYNAQDLNDPNCFMTAPSDRNTVNPRLGLLQDNGGATDTLLPAAGSPLVDGGDPVLCTAADQRGVPRPEAGRCDVGAIERTTPASGAPTVTAIDRSGATLTAIADPQFLGGTYSFRYGTTAAYGSTTPPQPLLGGTGAQPALSTLGGLSPGTVYHVQLVVSTPDGIALSPDTRFTTSGSPPTPAPAILGARLTHKRFRVARRATAISTRRRKLPKRAAPGTQLEFTLSTAAGVLVTITGRVKGMRSGPRCVAATTALRRAHARRCTIAVPPRTLTRAREPQGRVKIAFSGRIGSRALKPGSYTAKLMASNSGGTSAPVRLSFAIVK
jgi:hypothetical protein